MAKGPGRPARPAQSQDEVLDISASPLFVRCHNKVYVLSCDQQGRLTLYGKWHDDSKASLLLEMCEPHLIKIH